MRKIALEVLKYKKACNDTFVAYKMIFEILYLSTILSPPKSTGSEGEGQAEIALFFQIAYAENFN